MKKRSLEYEKKFRKYLFSFDLETHKKICKEMYLEINKCKRDKKMREK
tara:strand:+ start:658 stop:801 length:144 start_codon:yes stop_codon:yes gene_type:complete